MIKNIFKYAFVGIITLNLAVPVYAYELLSDNVPASHLKSTQSVKQVYVPLKIKDAAVEDLKIKNPKKPQYVRINYEDKAFPANRIYTYKKPVYTPITYKGDPIRETDMLVHFKKPVYTGKIVLDPGIPVKVSPTANIIVKYDMDRLHETSFLAETPLVGSKIEFKAVEDVYDGSKLIIPKGQIIIANITYAQLSTSGGEGGIIGAGRFRTYDNNGNIIYLSGELLETGASIGFLLYMLSIAAVPFTFGTSALIMFSPGFAGRLNKNQVYTVYYRPEN